MLRAAALLRLRHLILGSAAVLSACGGGGGSSSNTPTSANNTLSQAVSIAPPTAQEAHRLLVQASFGPTTDTINRVQNVGMAAWIDEQLDLPPSLPSHLSTVEASATVLAQDKPRAQDVVFSWWTHALTQPDQLRQRVAYALSQIFVVSTTNSTLADNSRLVASYMDMLTERSTLTYRELLEGVALHPAMGMYLSHLMNRKEDPISGRVPDENFAREVMQLFSIGLYELNDDGSLKLRDGQPIETYTSDDVKGLAKVFTGLGWHRPAGQSGPWWDCFYAAGTCNLPTLQHTMPMSTYLQEHSVSAKRFLGITIPAQTSPNPDLSIRLALDRLANHPNTAPFISKQLIQRLVSSNPSAAYIGRVTQVFRSSGGQLKAVVKAILMDDEARMLAQGPDSLTRGKLREPVLRWAQLLRSIGHQSTNHAQTQGFYLAVDTSNPTHALGQAPMAAPSVFNFFRPGYKPPQTALARQQLVSPEMQLTTETSVLGYANFIAESLERGWGFTHADTQRPDIQFDLARFVALDDTAHAARPQAMVDAVAYALTGGSLPDAMNEQVLLAVGAMPRGSAQALRRRAAAAVLLIAVSPPFLVQP